MNHMEIIATDRLEITRLPFEYLSICNVEHRLFAMAICQFFFWSPRCICEKKKTLLPHINYIVPKGQKILVPPFDLVKKLVPPDTTTKKPTNINIDLDLDLENDLFSCKVIV